MADRFNMFIPLLKVNEEKREVWGRATQEVVDGHREILDYATSVPNFQKWSVGAEKRSKGKSKGNLRAMHQPIAAGKLIAINFNDAEKAIDIGTFVSDDNEWKKVLDGTYTGFSIGGDYANRWMDHSLSGVTRYTADPHEISLVDAPAVPTATFELTRCDGACELRKFADGLTGTTMTPIEVEVNVEVEIGETQTETETEVEVPQEPVIMVGIDKAEGEISPLTDDESLNKSHQLEPGVAAEDVAIEGGVTAEAQPPIENVPEEILGNEQVAEIMNPDTFVPDVALDGKVHPAEAGILDGDMKKGGPGLGTKEHPGSGHYDHKRKRPQDIGDPKARRAARGKKPGATPSHATTGDQTTGATETDEAPKDPSQITQERDTSKDPSTTTVEEGSRRHGDYSDVRKSETPEWLSKFTDAVQVLKGGAGSGNFGHSGRPGVQGGSGGGGNLGGSAAGGTINEQAAAIRSQFTDPRDSVGFREGGMHPTDPRYTYVTIQTARPTTAEAVQSKVNAAGVKGKVSQNGDEYLYVFQPESISAKKVDAPEWLTKFQSAVQQLASTVDLVYELRKQEAEIKEKVTAELKQRGERVGIARREGSPLTPPQGWTQDFAKYADPANWTGLIDNPERAQAEVKAYNLRKDAGTYTVREWLAKGRRIARLASEISGVTYQFNPTEKTVEKSQQEKSMTTQVNQAALSKAADPMGLLRDVAGGLKEACKAIGTDPGAAQSLLLQMLAAIDVSDDVSAATPGSPKAPVSSGGTDTLAAAQAEANPPLAAAEAVETPELANAKGKTATETKTETTPAATETKTATTATDTKTETTDAYQKSIDDMRKMLETLTATVEAQNSTIEELRKSQAAEEELTIPVGDLNAILNNMPASQTDLLKALDEGNLAKAFDAVGGDPMKLYEQSNDLFVKQIATAGINVQKFMIFPSQEAIFPEPGK